MISSIKYFYHTCFFMNISLKTTDDVSDRLYIKYMSSMFMCSGKEYTDDHLSYSLNPKVSIILHSLFVIIMTIKQWRSQSALKSTHIKGRLLNQGMIVFNCVSFQNWNYS